MRPRRVQRARSGNADKQVRRCNVVVALWSCLLAKPVCGFCYLEAQRKKTSITTAMVAASSSGPKPQSIEEMLADVEEKDPQLHLQLVQLLTQAKESLDARNVAKDTSRSAAGMP